VQVLFRAKPELISESGKVDVQVVGVNLQCFAPLPVALEPSGAQTGNVTGRNVWRQRDTQPAQGATAFRQGLQARRANASAPGKVEFPEPPLCQQPRQTSVRHLVAEPDRQRRQFLAFCQVLNGLVTQHAVAAELERLLLGVQLQLLNGTCARAECAESANLYLQVGAVVGHGAEHGVAAERAAGEAQAAQGAQPSQRRGHTGLAGVVAQ